jgi:hypothetical protein
MKVAHYRLEDGDDVPELTFQGRSLEILHRQYDPVGKLLHLWIAEPTHE